MLKIMTWKGVKNAKQIYQKILSHPVQDLRFLANFKTTKIQEHMDVV